MASSLPMATIEPPPEFDLRRTFVAVQGQFGHREVHYRSGGRGPVVLLLHQSPQSSREMESLIRQWGSDFLLIAPDTPGYGFSTPLCRNGRPVSAATVDDIAIATVEFLDAIGVDRCAVYGFHTGASIGVALAERFPDRVSAIAANGLAILEADELASIERNYLPALEPRWDGGHLAWLWARLREQTIFFPWYDHRAAARLAFDVPPPERLQRGVEEFLAAGDHYRVAYAAAFQAHAERRLPRIATPLLVTAAARDPLAGHLARIGEEVRAARSSTLSIEASTDADDAVRRAYAWLLKFAADRAEPANQTGHDGDHGNDGPVSAYLGMPGRQVRMRSWKGPATSRHAVILLHPPAGSATAMDDMARMVATHATAHAVDLPGHGASDDLPVAELEGNVVEATARTLARALAPLIESMARRGVAPTIVGVGSSAPLAIELSRVSLPGRQVLLLNAPHRDATDIAEWLRDGLPPLTPVWFGGHLLEAWHMVRDGRLFDPWFRRRHPAARLTEPKLDPADIHREVRDLLRANGHWQPLLGQSLVRWRDEGPGAPAGPITIIADPAQLARALEDDPPHP